jgi:hypothetical protein
MWEFLKDLLKAPLPVILIIIGVGVVVVSLFGKVPWKGLEDRLDPIARMLAGLLGVVLLIAGFVVYASPSHPKVIEEYVAPVVIVIFAVLLGIEIIYLQREESRLVDRVEDATRRVLTGIPEIFDRAMWMMERCERELYFVNFALNFGIIHSGNSKVAETYAEITDHDPKRPFVDGTVPPFDAVEGDVKRFFDLFQEKVNKVRYVYILTTDRAGTRHFLDLLMGKPGYDYVSSNISQLESVIEVARATIEQLGAKRTFKPNISKFEHRTTDALPLQIFIAGLPENKTGCLVFLVGTGNAGQEKVHGFYTETEPLVSVFRDLALGLLRAPDNELKLVHS